MNKEQTKRNMAVMQAHLDGKQIQMYNCSEWSDISDPIWNFPEIEYRIKPKPMEVWVLTNGEGTCCLGNTYETETDAKNIATLNVYYKYPRLMREVC